MAELGSVNHGSKSALAEHHLVIESSDQQRGEIVYHKPSLERFGSFRELTRQYSGTQCPVNEKTLGAGDYILLNQVPIGEGGCIS